MTLEESVEPACVEGIEPELAMERACDAGLVSKPDLRNYRIMRWIPPAYFACGGFFLGYFTPFAISMAALCFSLGIAAELKGCRGYENHALDMLDWKHSDSQIARFK